MSYKRLSSFFLNNIDIFSRNSKESKPSIHIMSLSCPFVSDDKEKSKHSQNHTKVSAKVIVVGSGSSEIATNLAECVDFHYI